MCSIANPTEPIVDRTALIKNAVSEPNLKFDGTNDRCVPLNN